MTKTGVKLSASDYVHLHNHTHYSLLDGLQKVPAMLDAAKEMGMEAIAITDHGTLSGAVEFYKSAKDRNIKPIIGMETYVANRRHTDKDPAQDKARFHLILLAMNNTGYQNLMRLSTIANLDGFYFKPRIDKDLLKKYQEGLIVLSGCIGGELGELLRNNQDKQALDIARWYKEVFGDRYYIELQDHGHKDAPSRWDEQVTVNKKLISIANKLEIPMVVTCDAHYLKHEDQDAHEILLCVQTGSFLNDQDRMSLREFELHVTDPKDLINRWAADAPEVITNTKAIADRCDVELELGKILIPKFPVPQGYTEKSYLHAKVYQGLAWRYGGVEEAKSARLHTEEAKKTLPPEILERAEYELGVIDGMGFNGYFLIVSDFINWGKNQGIIFGPGRGSAAGSIVAYATRITELDPIKYDLLFERFLNPDRISMPDIDIDIQDTRRGEVIEYCAEKYGRDHVANIVTFGTMAARAAVRDVARVLQVPYAEADKLAKLIPPPVQGRHIPLAESIKNDAELKREYDTNASAKQVIDLAVRLEGTIRSHGVHAAGVVIAPDDIVRFVPLEMAQKGVVATQYAMGAVEDLGLLKMDFLGLSNLTIIRNALRIIKRVYNTSIELDEIPLDDAKTFELFQKGDTTGLFQFESAGMKRYLKGLQPTVFEDLIAMNALYRPGPMQFIDDFIDRKHGRKRIQYLHQTMENALENTYGILVYQEQVMQIAKDMCGFTGGQADTLRKGVAKKKPEILAALKKDFIEGAVKTSDVAVDTVEKFWSQLEAFASYAFPKAHSSCYATIGYWTAYLKAHYPDAFMAALMTSDFDDTERLAIEITECRRMGIEVLLPDVNESFVEFGIVPGKKQIRFGMNAIKNVGTGAAEEIIRVRDEGGPYTSILEFVNRVDTRKVNRKVWEALIKAGGFDSLGETRGDLLFNLDNLLGIGAKIHKDKETNQMDIFGGLDNAAPSVAPQFNFEHAPAQVTDHDTLQWERELLGLYLSSHPLDAYETYLDENAVAINALTPEMDNKSVTVGGVVSVIRTIVTKNGAKMAFVKLEDKTSETELIVFPSAYEHLAEVLIQDKIILASGKINCKDRDGKVGQEIKIMVNEARAINLDEVQNYKSTGKKPKPPRAKKPSGGSSGGQVPLQKLFVHLKDPNDHDKLRALKEVAGQHPGNNDLILVLGDNAQKTALKMPFGVALQDELTTKLSELFEPTCVAIK
jgi:DNA polymerase III subunit alpha